MGQYHKAYNLTKGEFLHPHKLGDGLKAVEIADSGVGGVATALVYLMVHPETRGGGDFSEDGMAGRWHGDHVVIIGDYAEQEDFVGMPEFDTEGQFPADEFADVTDMVRERLAEALGIVYSGSGWMSRARAEDEPEPPIAEERRQCPDCGVKGERRGHQECQFPQHVEG